jgi:hypothetical protein
MANLYTINAGLDFLDKDHYGSPGAWNRASNSAQQIYNILVKGGFKGDLPLKNENATFNAFKDRIKGFEEMKDNDLLVISFHGHGGVVPESMSKQYNIEKPDSGWCFFDECALDYELWSLLMNFNPKSKVVVISDACYSGDLTYAHRDRTRALPGFKKSNVELGFFRKNEEKKYKPKLLKPRRKRLEVPPEVIIISGAKGRGKTGLGKRFTYFVHAFDMVQLKTNFEVSYSEFFKELKLKMEPKQPPQIKYFPVEKEPVLSTKGIFTK